MTAVSEPVQARVRIVRDATTWFAYLLLGYFTFLNTFQGNIIPFLKVEFQLSYSALALHSSAVAVGILIIGLVGDRITARFGRRSVLIGSSLASSAAVVLLALAPSVQFSVGACFLIGLTGALIPAVVPALLSDLHGDGRDIALTEANAVCYAFAISAPLIAGLLAWMGWNWRLLPLAAVGACLVVLAIYWRAPVPSAVPRTAAQNSVPLPPAYWAYWAMLGFGVALEFTALLWAPAYLEQVIGLSQSAAAIGSGAFFLAMLLGRTIGVRIVAVYPAQRLFLLAVATTFIGFGAYWTAPVAWLAIAGLFVVGLGVSLFFPLTISFAMGVAASASDRAATRIMLAPGLAIILNPLLLGGLADTLGLWLAQGMVPVFAALVLGSFLVARHLEGRDYSASSS